MSTYLARNGKMLTRLNGTRYFGDNSSPVPPTPPTPTEVIIGDQTWMSTNLAVDDGQGGIYTQTVNYGQGDVTEYYYTWDAAVRVAATVSGWHLPSTTEWDTLADTVGGTSTAGTKLKSTYGWSSGNGTDDYGFSAFPSGYWNSGEFSKFEHGSYFWTSNERSATAAYLRYFYFLAAMKSDYYNKTNYAYTLRLIKDS